MSIQSTGRGEDKPHGQTKTTEHHPARSAIIALEPAEGRPLARPEEICLVL
jgi:hypothetical protein